VTTVDDLKKSKMFWLSGDDAMVQRWKAQGFQPVPLSAVDILSGLQTGMIDAYPTTPLIALSLQWYKSTPYMSSVGLDPLVGGLVMTKAAWNKLSPADRAAVSAACSKAEKRLKADVPRQDTTAVAEMRKRGLTLTKVPPQVVTQVPRDGTVVRDVDARRDRARGHPRHGDQGARRVPGGAQVIGRSAVQSRTRRADNFSCCPMAPRRLASHRRRAHRYS
jgi:TRAP-type mannitol/chloroaromatic compound transport system substrate-binding protein